jgi:hypothetical protein
LTPRRRAQGGRFDDKKLFRKWSMMTGRSASKATPRPPNSISIWKPALNLLGRPWEPPCRNDSYARRSQASSGPFRLRRSLRKEDAIQILRQLLLTLSALTFGAVSYADRVGAECGAPLSAPAPDDAVYLASSSQQCRVTEPHRYLRGYSHGQCRTLRARDGGR